MTVHVNHGIRGEEAERDEKFAKEFAQANGLEFQSYHVNIPMIAKNGNMSEEEAGRQERYRIFREEAKCYPDAKIADCTSYGRPGGDCAYASYAWNRTCRACWNESG